MLRRLTSVLIVFMLLLTLLGFYPVYEARGAVKKILIDELRFEVFSLPWFPPSDKAAEVIAEQLAQVGIKLELRRLESSIYYPKVENFEYEAHVLATSQSPNPLDMIESFHSSRAQPGIGSFWTHEDPEVDALIERARNTTDNTILVSLLHDIQDKLARESGFIPLYLTQSVKVIRAEWQNYTVMSGGLVSAFDIWSMLYMYKSDVPDENVFRIAFPSDILSTNPFMAVDLRSIWIINLIYDPLVRINPDMEVVPWLATSWTVSPDGLEYTFTLRNDVVWHDGTPLTADDVVFTFEEGMRQNTTRFVTLKDIIDRVEKVDDYTVKFILKSPYPFFLLNLATGYIYIVPKHVAEGVDLRTWENPTPLGSGPFKWSERVIGETIVLDKNEDFWMPNVPKITRVIMRVIPEAESRYLAIKNGEVDTERYDTAITLIDDALQDPNLEVVTTPGLWLVYAAFNTHTFFNDPKVFEAIQYAINREEVVERANGGYGYPVYTVLNPYWHGEYALDLTFEYDPDKAIEILESAGWRDVDGDGVREYAPLAGPPTPPPMPVNLTGLDEIVDAINVLSDNIVSLSDSIAGLSNKVDLLSQELTAIKENIANLQMYLIAVVVILIITLILTGMVFSRLRKEF